MLRCIAGSVAVTEGVTFHFRVVYAIGGAGKSLARPERKQATATEIAHRLTCFLSASVTRKCL